MLLQRLPSGALPAKLIHSVKVSFRYRAARSLPVRFPPQ